MDSKNALAALGGTVALGGLYKLLDNKFLISKDVSTIWELLKVKRQANALLASRSTMADVWEEAVDKYKDKVAVVDDEIPRKEWTFREIDAFANQVAQYLQTEHHIVPGGVVALYMENCAEFLAIWLGVLKLGAVCALINYNVKGKALKHCLQISGATVLLHGAPLTAQIQPVTAILPTICFRNELVTGLSSQRPPRSGRKSIGFNDNALLVYTSGTTGLPKAATIRHLRLYLMGMAFGCLFKVYSSDRIYCVLPLYHSAGGLCGTGMMITTGATLVLKKKFSASQFWSDCRELDITVVQYIGELCRYLLSVEPQPLDATNKVRIAIGNGLRPDIWGDFQERFGIPEIGEFYGSTEGNASLFNHCTDKSQRGAVGFLGGLLRAAGGLKLVKFDVENEVPIRDKKTNFCVECGPNEVGELLGKIVKGDPTRAFAGYHGNKEATKKKLAYDVFVKGDCYFRTGDLLKRDNRGYFYFMDRIGDTFRWKGENVSTTEVAETVSVFPGIEEVNVYGVALPGKDGRACMAAIVLKEDSPETFDWAALYAHVQQELPEYSTPLFFRLLPKIDLTGTFKHKKVQLRKQGCDPSLVSDPVYYLDKRAATYKPFTVQLYSAQYPLKAKL